MTCKCRQENRLNHVLGNDKEDLAAYQGTFRVYTDKSWQPDAKASANKAWLITVIEAGPGPCITSADSWFAPSQ